MSFFSKALGIATGGVSDILGGGGGGSSGGGGGSSSSTSSTSDAQIGASENGQAVQGGAVGKDNAITLGTNSKLNAGGVELQGPNTGVVNISGSAGAEAISKTFAATIERLVEKPLTPGAVPLATDDKPPAATENSTLILWAVGLLVIVLAALAFRSKKSA